MIDVPQGWPEFTLEREYSRIIGELSIPNAARPIWWASSLGSKNFGASTLWERLQAFLRYRRPPARQAHLKSLAWSIAERYRGTQNLEYVPELLARSGNPTVLIFTHFARQSWSTDDGRYRDLYLGPLIDL